MLGFVVFSSKYHFYTQIYMLFKHLLLIYIFLTSWICCYIGAHTIGKAKCGLFKNRIYNETNIDSNYAKSLQEFLPCPKNGGDNNLASLDTTTPNFFDNAYYKNLLNKEGLLHSDQQLYNGGSTDSKVSAYASNPLLFSFDFANAMVKMGNLSPLTGYQGQIRKYCSRVNWVWIWFYPITEIEIMSRIYLVVDEDFLFRSVC